jgi:ABC-type glycerol-3-phosphate transport system permease component
MDQAVFLLVVGGRFVLPLLIPRFPLPAVLACLVLDGLDQTIFQLFGHDPPGYQSYDKAMDIFYLSIAYLAAMRNWDDLPAFGVARFLFYYRLCGAFLFEMTHARAVLVAFPNTFEYFFIAYEIARTRWTVRPRARAWVATAGALWVLVKLPQEWWLHVAQLDVTDTLRDHPWTRWALASATAAGTAIVWFVVRSRVPEPDHPLRLGAGPVPGAVDAETKVASLRVAGGWVWSWMTLEKVVLVGLIAVIYAQMLPGIEQSSFRVFTSVGALVVLNAAITLVFSRRRWTIESAGWAVLARLVTNVLLVFAAYFFFNGRAAGWDTFFFLCLISLVTTLHDRYQPIYAYREKVEDSRRVARRPIR